MKKISIRFVTHNWQPYLNDVQDIPRAFSPYLTIDNNAIEYLKVSYLYDNYVFSVKISSSFARSKISKISIKNDDIFVYKRKTKHFIKNLLYRYLSKYLGIKLPYGSLTGVRPTKLYYDLLETHKNAKGTLKAEYGVSKERINLLSAVVENQRGIYRRDNTNCDIFVNIPFCPTRCNYCSFISTEISKARVFLRPYVEKVKHDIVQIKEAIKSGGYNLRSVYIGGGTPTSIGVGYLNEILQLFADCGLEFTVEAGRPDTLNNDILSMMSQHKVTRISINPQTFNENTLRRIGRCHSIKDFYNAFNLARQYRFDINVDLIAGLEGEDYKDFCNSVDKAIEVQPENITIHTLSIKRGATIRDKEKAEFGLASAMLQYAHMSLRQAGYSPYYLYRQKNMADNLENTGFCKKNKQCVYNIDMMEDISSIFGAGAGAITKLCKSGRIKRHANPKGLKEYLER